MDFGGGEASHGAKRESNGGRCRKRGVTAHKKEEKRVVWLIDGDAVDIGSDHGGEVEKGIHFPGSAGNLAADMVGHTPTSDRHEPRKRMFLDGQARLFKPW